MSKLYFFKIIIVMISHLSYQNNNKMKGKKKFGSWREVREEDLRVSLEY